MRTKNTGFALIEVIVAIVILSGVTAGAMTLVMSAGNAVIKNQDRLTATYLTQECLELSRNVRDTAWRQSLPWDCAFEETPIEQCEALQGDILHLIQGENSIEILGDISKFSRSLTGRKKGESRIITCTVTWLHHTKSEKIAISEILTNWRKK